MTSFPDYRERITPDAQTIIDRAKLVKAQKWAEDNQFTTTERNRSQTFKLGAGVMGCFEEALLPELRRFRLCYVVA